MQQTRDNVMCADHRLAWLRLGTALGLLAMGGLLLTACGDSESDREPLPAPAAGVMDGTMDGQIVEPATAATSGLDGGQLPLVEGVSASENGVPAIPVAYRGGWANDAQGCALPDGQWRFDELTTTTPKGVACSLTGMSNPAGSPSTTLLLRCEGEGMVANEAWEISSPGEGKMNFIRTNESSTTLPLMLCPTVAELDSGRLHGVDRS